MPAKLNGNLKWIVTTIAGIIASYAVLAYIVQEMKPQVKLNSEHRIQDEVTDEAINDKLAEILLKVSK